MYLHVFLLLLSSSSSLYNFFFIRLCNLCFLRNALKKFSEAATASISMTMPMSTFMTKAFMMPRSLRALTMPIFMTLHDHDRAHLYVPLHDHVHDRRGLHHARSLRTRTSMVSLTVRWVFVMTLMRHYPKLFLEIQTIE